MRRWKVLAGGAVLMAALTAGCSGDNKAACDTLQQEMSALTSKAMQQVGDPAAMGKTYRDAAAKFRSEGAAAGGDVKAAADAVASELERLGAGVEAGSTEIPDTSGLIAAGAKLQSACV